MPSPDNDWRFREDRQAPIIPASANVRTAYTVFWLDADGFVFRSHYFESYEYTKAYRRALHKKHRMGADLGDICGMLVTKSPAELEKRFFNAGVYMISDFIEIESHLYAPRHLLKGATERTRR